MKEMKKKILSFALAMLVMFSTALGNAGLTVSAEETSVKWTKVNLADITAEDTVMITMTTSSGKTYALSTTEKNNSGGPLAKSVVIDNNSITTSSSTGYGFQITAVEGGYHIMSGESLLYVTATNNGVRIGNPELESSAVFSVVSGYLAAVDSKNATRYLGVYNDADWRCYTNTTGNTKDQTLGFWKLNTSGSTEDTPSTPTCETVTASVKAGVVEVGTKVELSCGTEDAVILYNTDGSENYSSYTDAITINDATTIYARAAKEGYNDSAVVQFAYTVRTAVTPLATGDQVVFYSDNAQTVMTAADVSGKLNGVSATLTEDHTLQVEKRDSNASLADKIALFDVVLDENGYYTFSCDGKYLTSGASGSSLTLTEEAGEYSLWQIYNASAAGKYLIKNVNAAYTNQSIGVVSPQYIEWYKGFTTYSFSDSKESIYMISFHAMPTIVDAPATPEITPEAGKIKKNTKVTITDTTEDAVIYYTVDGSDPSKESNTARAVYGKDTEITITEACTVKAAAYKNGVYSDVASAEYTLSEESSEDVEDGKLASGTYVIWAPAYNKALSSVYGGFYNNGVAVNLSDDLLTGYGNTEVWTVTRNEDDTYYISYGGKNLAMAASFSSLTLGETNDKWVLEDAENGMYYVKNVGRSCYIEWYDAKSYWSGYNKISTGSEGMFALRFTPAEKGYDTDASVEETVAQWGGGGPYDEIENATVINGDKYEVGDKKDTSAEFSIVANGSAGKPYQTTTPSTGGTTYYMGGANIGKAEGDYMQFAVNTAGYGDMELSFRIRSTNAAPGSFQLQYSTDNGATFKNFTTGEYSYSYTKYVNNEPTEASGSGKITDGIARPSKATTYYVTHTFDVPSGAENAENLLIRLVAGTDRADGGSGAVSGNIRLDSVVLTGSPIVDDSITGYVSVDPDGKNEDQPAGTELTMTSATEGAAISYRFVDTDGNGEWKTYVPEAKPVLPDVLPAVLEVKATSADKADSITRIFTYAAGSVSPVKMTPNGGGVYIAGDFEEVTLSCETQGATIYYKVDDAEEFAEYTEPIILNKGFGKKVIQAYAVKEGFKDSTVVTRTFTERNSEEYNIYFGQLHSHTSYSDGAGTAKDAYEHATNVKNLDFLAVTDHSNSFDNADSASIADGSVSAEWVEGHELAEQYTTNEFVGLFGYEMTWSNGLGHMNTFNTPGFQSRTQTEYKTYATALQNYYATLKTQPDSINQFNHPGTTFGDFSDFAYYDEEIDQLITIIEVGNGEGAIGSSGYFPSYEYYTRALDKGWHVAPTNNQDNHKGLWGDANTGRSVVLADSLTEDDIYDAMRNYRVYATEDNDLSIMYTLDDNIMGSILAKSDVGDKVNLKVDLSDPTDSTIGKVEVIVNGGLSIASEAVLGNAETVNFEVPADYSYYYIRVTEADGDIAVTAPVWVGEVEAVGISALSTDTSLPIQGKPIDITLDLYNNEKTDLNVESIVFTIDDEVIHTADLANLTKVEKESTASYTFSYTHDGLGVANIYATVTANLDGVEKVYKEVLQLSYASSQMVSKVIVDGSHYNDYVTGYYGGNMNNFTTIAADNMVEVEVVKETITDDMLADCSLLVISAPARTSGTATAGDYEAASFDDEFIATVKRYVENGGNVIVCGLADYQDTKAASADYHASVQLNKLLNGIGATLRINDDEAYDEVKNGGQAYRIYPENFNADSRWTENLAEGQTYSQYSGCTVDITNAGSNDVVKAAEWIVRGFDSTYSIDSDKDGIGGVAKGEAIFLASQDTVYGGTIFAAGGVFLSDFEVKAELDNIWDLPYANRTIAENILNEIKVELPLSTIAEMRTGNLGDVFRIQGYATSSRVDGNAFFDAMYIQDGTAGTTVFPIAEDGLKIGTKLEIVGYVDQYQGDKEIQVVSYKILNEEPYVYAPQQMTAAEAMDYQKSGGKLVQIQGKVVDVLYDAEGTGVSQFWIDDGSGTIGNVFIDGYILSASTGKNQLASIVKPGATISATGLVYAHPEGASDVPVTCLRVRNCDEIIAIAGQNTGNSGNTGNIENTENNTDIGNSAGADSTGNTENSENTGSTASTENNSTLQNITGAIVADNSGWEKVVTDLGTIASGGTVKVELSNSSTMPGRVLESIKGKNVNLVITMPGKIRWTVNGMDVTADHISDIDMGVVMNTNHIPNNLVQELAKDKTCMQISLNHNGEFGFGATLTLNVGKEQAGRYARLYYYNEASGKLEYQTGCKIDADGDASLDFTHASDYLIVIDDVPVVSTGDNTPIAQLILLLLMVAVIFAATLRKRKA